MAGTYKEASPRSQLFVCSDSADACGCDRMRPPPAVASFVNGPFVLLWVSLGLQGSATGIFLQLNCCAVLGGVQT